MRLNAVVIAAIIFGPHAAYALEPEQHPLCKQAGLEYSEGATICECPSLKAEAGHATGGPPGLAVSRRLQCRSGTWVVPEEKCAELTGRSEYMIDEHRKLYEIYCPRPNTAEEVGSMITKATLRKRSQSGSRRTRQYRQTGFAYGCRTHSPNIARAQLSNDPRAF
jgi:hypothetical protein